MSEGACYLIERAYTEAFKLLFEASENGVVIGSSVIRRVPVTKKFGSIASSLLHTILEYHFKEVNASLVKMYFVLNLFPFPLVDACSSKGISRDVCLTLC